MHSHGTAGAGCTLCESGHVVSRLSALFALYAAVTGI